MGQQSGGIDADTIKRLAREIDDLCQAGVEVGLVIGGGNIIRGATQASEGLDRVTGDHMGMLATVINGMALQSAMEAIGIPTRVQTAIPIQSVAEPFIRRRAMRHMDLGRVVIFVAGTGNPFFSTDTAAALRASEIGAEAILKATKVDGIYTADPKKDTTATKYDRITYSEALSKRLQVMDSTAFTLCMDNRVPILVFDLMTPNNIRNAVLGLPVGTLVTAE